MKWMLKNVDRYIVQKSDALLQLSKGTLPLLSCKLLDVYLAFINSHKPENRELSFTKLELENILHITRIRSATLVTCIELLGCEMILSDNIFPIPIFDKCESYIDDDGLWRVNLRCSSSISEHIFNLDSRGYMKYPLGTIIDINSRYSYFLFHYVEHNRFRGTWEVSVEELRVALGCFSSFYNSYKEFNRNILLPSLHEISEKTNCSFTYTPIRRNRYVRKIRFSVKKLSSLQNSIDMPAVESNMTQVREPSARDSLLSALIPDGKDTPEFTGADAQHIFAVLGQVPLGRMPSMSDFGGDPHVRRHAYLSEKYAAMNRAAQLTTINNRAAYLVSLIKKDTY